MSWSGSEPGLSPCVGHRLAVDWDHESGQGGAGGLAIRFVLMLDRTFGPQSGSRLGHVMGGVMPWETTSPPSLSCAPLAALRHPRRLVSRDKGTGRSPPLLHGQGDLCCSPGLAISSCHLAVGLCLRVCVCDGACWRGMCIRVSVDVYKCVYEHVSVI